MRRAARRDDNDGGADGLGEGRIYLMEVKRPLGKRGGQAGRKLKPGQEEFKRAASFWGVEVHVVRTERDALRVIGREIA